MFDMQKVFTLKASNIIKDLVPCLQQKQLKDLSKKLQELLKDLIVLDIQVLKKLINEADKARIQIKGKDIILFLGDTGAGKTTTIHFLAGSKMGNLLVKGISHIGPNEIINSDAEALKTNPLSQSVTKFITAVLVEVRKKQFVLCDSPGFGDSQGPTQDLANGIGVIRAVQECKSVSPVILCSQNSIGDRSEGFKRMAYLLTSMIDNINDNKELFQYIFTKFDKTKQKQMPNILQDILENMNTTEDDNSDEICYSLLESMAQKAEDKKIISLNPLEDEYSKVLRELISKESIHHPENVFKQYFTSETLACVREQIGKDQKRINDAYIRGDYDLIVHKLQEIAYLNEVLQNEKTLQIYNDCINGLIVQFNSKYNETSTHFLKFFELNNDLTEDEIQDYMRVSQNDKRADALKQTCLNNTNIIMNCAYTSLITDQSLRLWKQAQPMNIDDPQLQTIFKKLKIIGKYYQTITPLHEKLQQETLLKFKESILKFNNNAFNQDDQQQCKDVLFMLERSYFQLKDHIPEKELQLQFDQLNQQFQNTLKKKTQIIDQMLQKQYLGEAGCRIIKNYLGFLKLCCKTYSAQAIFNLNPLETTQNTICSKIIEKFDKQIQETKSILQYHEQNNNLEQRTTVDNIVANTDEFQKLIAELYLIQSNFEEIQNETTEQYFKIIHQIINEIYEFTRSIETKISILLSTKDDKIYKQLGDSINNLHKLNWIDKYQEGLQAKAKAKIENSIKEQLQSLRASAQSLTLSVKDSDEVDKMAQIYFHMEQMNKIIKDDHQTVQENDLQIIEWFVVQSDRVFKQIRESCLEQLSQSGKKEEEEENKQESIMNVNLIYYDAEEALKYLKKFEQLKYNNFSEKFRQIKSNAINLQDELQKCIKICASKQEQLIQKMIQEITEQSGHQIVTSQKLNSLGREIQSILNLLQAIQTNAPLFKQNFDPQNFIFNKSKQELQIIWDDLEQKIEQAPITSSGNQVQLLRLRQNLQIAKALQNVDAFLDETKSFRALFYKNNGVFQQKYPEGQKQTFEQISLYKFRDILPYLKMLKTSSVEDTFIQEQLNDTKKMLQDSLEELIKNTLEMATRIKFRNLLSDKVVQEIVTNINRIKGARCVSEYLSDIDLETSVTTILKVVNDGYKEHLKKLQQQIQGSKFIVANKEKECLDEIYVSFTQFFDEESQIQVDQFFNDQEEKLQNLCQFYSQLQIKDYALNPPKQIIEELGNCSIAKELYQKYKKQLIEICSNSFHQEFQKIKQTVSKCEQELQIKQCERLLKCLTDDMGRDLKYHLEEALLSIQSQVQTRQELICLATEQREWNKLEEQIIRDQEANNIRGLNEIQTLYGNELKFESSALKQKSISDLNDPAYLQDLENFIMLDNSYNKNFPNTTNISSQYLKTIQSDLSQKFLNTLKQLKQDIQQEYDLEDDSLDYESISAFNNSFKSRSSSNNSIEDFILFLHFKDKRQKVCSVFIQTFDNMLDTYNKQIQTIVDNMTLNGQKYLTECNFEQLYRICDQSQGYSRLNSKLEGGCFEEKSVKRFCNTIQKISTAYDELKKSITFLIGQVLGETKDRVKRIKEEYKQEHDRENDFILLNKQLKILNLIKNRGDSQQRENANKYLTSFIQEMKESIDTMYNEFYQITEDQISNDKQLRTLNIYFSNLKSLKHTIDSKYLINNFDLRVLEKKAQNLCQNIAQNSMKHIANDNKIEISQSLELIKKISINIPHFQEAADYVIDQFLKEYKKQQNQKGLRLLSLSLQDLEYGQMIIQKHSLFTQCNLSIFQEKTNKHGIEYVLERISGDEQTKIDTKYLMKQYQIYKNTYEEIIKKASDPKKVLQTIDQLAIELQKYKQKNSTLQKWSGTFKQDLAIIVAKVSVIWTLQASKDFFESNDDNSLQELIKLHPAQITAIFCLLGLGDFSNKKIIQNCFIEIGTGEGKSFTLGISSCVFALLGFEVNCACYSKYLSDRDYDSFSQLFQTLKIEQFIHYGTFNKLCERVINLKIDFREAIKNIITNNAAQIIPIEDKEQKLQVLLIDEVDVFFSKDFFGELYCPQTSLKNDYINALLDFIWINKSNALSFEKVRQSQEYNKVITMYSNWSRLIDEAVKDMISAVINSIGHQYEKQNNKIGYKEQDQIQFNISYGYKTIFAYYQELEKLRSLDSTDPSEIIELEKNMREASCIGLSCGSFSYAEIPFYFQYRMGVTGTLKCLNTAQLNLIQERYEILKRIYMPSVFGDNQFTFNEREDVIICNEADYYNEILNDINIRLDVGRPVLLFFENNEELMKFQKSPQLVPLKNEVEILTEVSTIGEKENKVMKATSSDKVTLCNKIFGRGTDFKVFDPKVIQAGGVHVIQTFFSEDISEEVQIKGRTARQGHKGTYKLIILDSTLEKYQIQKKNGIWSSIWKLWNSGSELSDHVKHLSYDNINTNRNMISEDTYGLNIMKADNAKLEHDNAIKLQNLIYSGNKEEIFEQLLKYNLGALLQLDSRTVILMDATGSMSSLITKTKATIQTMFERASSILVQEGRNEKCFQVQLVAYRNYNAPEDLLLQSSPWTSKADELKTFLATIKANYGLGPEAIEAGLWFAKQEHQKENINQIIIIGDAPPNPDNKVQEYIQKYYKGASKYNQVQGHKEELKEIINSGIKVHAFYVHQQAKLAFEEMAKMTDGQCAELDIISESGADVLTNLITQEILRSVGGENFVRAYQRRYL